MRYDHSQPISTATAVAMKNDSPSPAGLTGQPSAQSSHGRPGVLCGLPAACVSPGHIPIGASSVPAGYPQASTCWQGAVWPSPHNIRGAPATHTQRVGSDARGYPRAAGSTVDPNPAPFHGTCSQAAPTHLRGSTPVPVASWSAPNFSQGMHHMEGVHHMQHQTNSGHSGLSTSHRAETSPFSLPLPSMPGCAPVGTSPPSHPAPTFVSSGGGLSRSSQPSSAAQNDTLTWKRHHYHNPFLHVDPPATNASVGGLGTTPQRIDASVGSQSVRHNSSFSAPTFTPTQNTSTPSPHVSIPSQAVPTPHPAEAQDLADVCHYGENSGETCARSTAVPFMRTAAEVQGGRKSFGIRHGAKCDREILQQAQLAAEADGFPVGPLPGINRDGVCPLSLTLRI